MQLWERHNEFNTEFKKKLLLLPLASTVQFWTFASSYFLVP
jgi:hypothetical protein